VLALGEARHIIVVSSAWHLRVPYFFAPYRRYGLRVSYRVSALHGSWPRMLGEELRSGRVAPAQRRAAMAQAPDAQSHTEFEGGTVGPRSGQVPERTTEGG
jgi:hypothetical protein